MTRLVKAIFCLSAGVLCLSNTYAQKKDAIAPETYTSAAIPDSLKEDANSIIRYSDTRVDIKGPGKAVVNHHSVVTILNEKGNDKAVLFINYNKFNSIDDAEMRVYDAAGLLIKKYKKSDMYDGSATDDATIVSDDRFKAVRHAISAYPITIETIVQETTNSYLDLGNWYIQDDDQSVQQSVYTTYSNPAVGFHYINHNTKIKPVKSSLDGKDVYAWEVRNLKAIKLEEGAKKWAVIPRISFATNLFEFAGRPGDMSSWSNFGNWIKELNKDVNALSPERCAEIQKMTDTIKTDKEKAKFLYDYMQKNMRYVSVQLGIGGLKPFPASFVDQKKYGDCKALSNYMQALLKAVNIPSYYTVINAGANEEPANPAFVSSPFNHIVLCVPFKNDTTWLECTSNITPFGKPGTFTENRYGMLITEAGGKLVKTPVSKMEDNRFDAEVNVNLLPDGGANAHVKLLTTGGYREDYDGLQAAKTDDQKEYLIRSLKIKQPSVVEVKFGTDVGGTKQMDIELEYDRYADIISGDKQFYSQNLFNIWNISLPIIEKRKTDYYFPHPMQKSSITLINLPPGYGIESMPASANLKFSYGSFEINYAFDTAKNQVKAVSSFKLSKHVIPAAAYTEMQKYMDEISKTQSKKLVLKKMS